MPRQPLIYIAGAGHSGSTLLEMFVSGAPGHVGLGEIFQLVDRRNPIIDNLDGHLCSCRLPVAECPYWQPVIARLEAHPRSDEAARYRALAEGFAAQFGPSAVMIDSSKSPEGLAAAAASGAFDIKVLHLARDVRAWLVSMQTSYQRNEVATWAANRARSGLLKGTARFVLRHPLADAGKWLRLNRQVEEVIARYRLPSLAVSYDRLCAETQAVKGEIEAFIGAGIADYGDTGARAANHSIFGNRMRFEPAKLREIRYDSGWREDSCWRLPYDLVPGLESLNTRLGQGAIKRAIAQ